MQTAGRFGGVVLAALAAASGLRAAELVVRLNGQYVHVSAPGFHFLTGKPLDRLKNGSPVAFDFQLRLLGESRLSLIQAAVERFVVSYDLWEEKFSVARIRERGNVSNLRAAAAEAWCVEAMRVPAGPAPDERKVWVNLEVRADESKASTGVVGEPGINLTSLVDLFSRTTRGQQPRWSLESGPHRLGDLRKAAAKGAPPG